MITYVILLLSSRWRGYSSWNMDDKNNNLLSNIIIYSCMQKHVYDLEMVSFVALVHPIQPPSKHTWQQFACFRLNLFCCCRCGSKSTLSNKSEKTPILSVCKKLWMPSSLSLNLAPYNLYQMRYNKIGSCPLKRQLCE